MNTESTDQHTDYFPGNQYLLVWSFDFLEFETDDFNKEADDIFRQIYTSFKILADSKNEKMRQRNFSVWAGEYNGLFLIGLPGKISSSVSDVFYENLMQVGSYRSMEYGNVPSIPMTPRFVYDKGSVVEYGLDQLAGKETYDDYYNTGLLISFRNWAFK